MDIDGRRVKMLFVPNSQAQQNHSAMSFANQNTASPKTPDLLVPNPRLRLREQVREVMRFKHYAVRDAPYLWRVKVAGFG
jgi:hypothetical protein